MKKPKLILIGGGGHCKSCIDVIEQEDKFCIAGIIDLKEKTGEKIIDYFVIGTDNDLEKLTKSFQNFFITIGQIKSPDKRISIYNKLIELKVNIPFIISPHAYVSKHSTIGRGTIIMHNAVVNAGARIGDNCIINSRSLIEHDAIIGNHSHISTGAIINGDCSVGDNSFIGSGSVFANGISVCSNVIIGAGSLIIDPIVKKGTYYGCPIKN